MHVTELPWCVPNSLVKMVQFRFSAQHIISGFTQNNYLCRIPSGISTNLSMVGIINIGGTMDPKFHYHFGNLPPNMGSFTQNYSNNYCHKKMTQFVHHFVVNELNYILQE